jgi:outer membrane protein OmpA-like peptidoglycan-associated protein
MSTLRRTFAVLASLFLTTISPYALSQQAPGFAINRFDPSERGSDWFALESLDLRGEARMAFGVVGDWSHRPLVLYAPDGSLRQSLIKDQLFLHVGGGIILAERLRLSVNLPIAAYQQGTQGTIGATTYRPPTETSVGDLRVGADLRLFGTYGDAFTTALGVQVHVPTGTQADYTGDGKVRIVPRLLGAGEIGPFAYALKVGMQYRALEGDFANSPIGTELLLGAAAGFHLADRKLLIGPEVYGSTVVGKDNASFKKLTSPLEVLFGARFTFADDFRIGAGVGPGLTRGIGTPELRVVGSLEWFPAIAPPPPPPSDRDNDAIIDTDDACPDVPGVRTEDPKTNGCPPPPPDRDNDGILDAQDACPETPGVKTDDPKTNGCPPPPPDRDKDGIFDPDDACPDTPGVRTDDPKTNGCPPPPPDRDKDGILDPEDACPDTPGPRNQDPKKNGCPEARIEAGEIKILQQVKFKTNSAEILPESDSILSAVAKILGDHPEITNVRIEGHTDNRGGAAMNLALSGRRAASVVNWLVRRGIDKSRLSSKGFGLTRPIDSNTTEEGRQNNRRVEFHIDSGDGQKK